MSDKARDQSISRPLRVGVVDRCVPLYREGLYAHLMSLSGVECTIVAGAKPIERMATVPFPGPGAPGAARWNWIDAPCHRIPLTRGTCAWQWGAVKAGLSRRFDALILMANPNDPGLWLCALAARLTGKRVIFWTHGLIRRDSPWRRRVRVWWMRLAHGLTIYGHLGKVNCMQAGLAADRCHVCYNSLDYPRQKSLRERVTATDAADVRRELFGDAAPPIILSLSRLNAFKKIDLLLRAHALLVQRGVRAGLLIVGDGPERSRLESLTDELGIRDQVRFIGECYDEHRLSRLLAASDVAVTPGAIGLTVMHCLAYGVPCITHDDWFDQMPEFEAIVEGKTGGFFRKDDPADLARAITRWIEPGRREAASTACIRHIERFYQPRIQASVMLRAVRGEPADDLAVAFASAAD